MRIALVLASVPGYSETFFRSKIDFLSGMPGWKVMVLADRKATTPLLPEGIELHYGLGAWSGVTFLKKLIQYVWAAGPIKIVRLLAANRASGLGWRMNVSSLYRSIHLLSVRCDWLHFGFGTMAIGREHVAAVIGARMAVSFRGFDICIYPVKHPGCYRLTWTCTDRVHVISDDLRQAVLANGCPSSDQIIKITPAIDTHVFQPVRMPEGEPHPWRMLTLARLHWKKGLEYTLEALAEVQRAGISFTYTVVGEGEEYERLMFAVHQLGLSDRVIFAGKLPPEAVRELLRSTDLYLQYSIQEGFCNAVLEAQAMGCLCVVSDAEGLAENVLHGVTGWVVPRRQAARLADQIVAICHSAQAARAEMVQRAAKRISGEFSLDRQRQEFVSFYQ